MLAPPQLNPTTATKPLGAVSAKKKWWVSALPIVGWQIGALLFVELVLYGAGIGEEEIFKFDKQLGFRHFPDKLVTWRSEGYARSYFDADGMREVGLTIAKPANTLRVALLGDSEVESLQVPIEKTFGQLIEKNIGAVNGKNVQVLNFGNSGYSTTQECLILEDKVFKYQPDLVILGYSNRDMVENWSPPDETVSNVRPAALKLPGRELIIDNSPVLNWLKSPRARFLQSIEWFRHHSRVWGIISATELQLSMKDPIVKSLLNFSTNPVRSMRGWFRSAKAALTPAAKSPPAQSWAAKSPSAHVPAVAVTVVSGSGRQALALAVNGSNGQPLSQVVRVSKVQSLAPVAPKASILVPASKAASAPVIQAVAVDDPAQRNQYTQLVAATMGGLIDRMNKDCSSHKAKFLVAGLPCRFDLAPFPGAPVISDLTYNDQLVILNKLCRDASVAFIDTNSPARILPVKQKESLFFSVHLATPGHVYMSEQLMPAVRAKLSD